MASTAELAAEALRAAGHSECTESRNVGAPMLTTGFSALPGSDGRVIVIAVLGDDVEGHPESPAHTEARTRMAAGYRQSLEAAGWAVDDRRTGLVVSRPGLDSDPEVARIRRNMDLLAGLEEDL